VAEEDVVLEVACGHAFCLQGCGRKYTRCRSAGAARTARGSKEAFKTQPRAAVPHDSRGNRASWSPVAVLHDYWWLPERVIGRKNKV
jgi:hypothetical protein